jgi:adenosylhomocysteine nucleosidase
LTTIAILSALLDEQRGLLEELSNPVKERRAGRTFWRGQWHGRDVVLALSKIGKVAAATTATTLIEAFGVKAIVFTGVAGGVGAGVKVGDVVVASDFVQHDMDASPLFPRYEVPLYGCNSFACDPDLTTHLFEAAQAGMAWASGRFDLVASQGTPAVHLGLIASGDRFIGSASDAAALLLAMQERGLMPLAVEMEGAAVAQVCRDYGVPFAAVRTVSDRADDQAHVDFSVFVKQVASPYALVMIRNLMHLLSKIELPA